MYSSSSSLLSLFHPHHHLGLCLALGVSRSPQVESLYADFFTCANHTPVFIDGSKSHHGSYFAVFSFLALPILINMYDQYPYGYSLYFKKKRLNNSPQLLNYTPYHSARINESATSEHVKLH